MLGAALTEEALGPGGAVLDRFGLRGWKLTLIVRGDTPGAWLLLSNDKLVDVAAGLAQALEQEKAGAGVGPFETKPPAPDDDMEASRQDEARFRGWLERVKAGLPKLHLGMIDARTDDRRMELIHEIHADVAGRWPLGIAEQLGEVIRALHVDDDKDGIELLEDLADTEKRSRELNGGAP